jgi:hypothetical protein
MSKCEAAESQILADIEELCGEPALLSFEDPEIYRKLLLKPVVDVKPSDVIERIWLRDIADHSWEIRRLRRFKVQLIERRQDDLRRQTIAEYVQAGEKIPPKITFTEFTIVGLFVEQLDNYGCIDALLASAEARLLALLREIGRRREHLASRLRKASNDIIDGEFKELAPDRESVGDAENSQPTQTTNHGADGEAAGEEQIDPDCAGSHPAATAAAEDWAELADDLDQGHQGEAHQGEAHHDEGYYPPAPTPS